jgi:hypothetical protein
MNTPETIARVILWRISTLKHCRLTADENAEFHAGMRDALTAADAAGIPWAVQNALLYIGEKYDVRAWYLSDLLRMAIERSGVKEAF